MNVKGIVGNKLADIVLWIFFIIIAVFAISWLVRNLF